MLRRRFCMMALAALVLSVTGCAGLQKTGSEKSDEAAQEATEAEGAAQETGEDGAEEDELEAESEEFEEEEEEDYTEEELEKMACINEDGDSPSDFVVSDPKTNVIWFDMDNDQKEERLTFEFNDLGDEAPSFIKVTLEMPDGDLEAMIEGAYALYWVCAAEDDEGTLLDIGYEMGDYSSHEEEGMCQLKLRDGQLVVEYEEM